MRLIYIFIACILLVLHAGVALAEGDPPPAPPSADEELEEELRYLKAETYVITASRVEENIKKATSSITVITDRQIRQMGARHLADVLQTVPGMNYYYSHLGSYSAYARGLWINGASRTLVMINSHPINDSRTSGAMMYDTMVLDNVKKIEFIRGPGSALYGANAFNGVINIITKEAEDVDGVEITARGGSYDTQQYNLLFGKAYKNIDAVFNFNYFNTHGFNGHVNKDTQTFYDQLFGTHASLAPGRIEGANEKYDASLTLKYKGLTFDGKYVDRDRNLPVSVPSALNNKSIRSIKDYHLNLSYDKTLWEGLDIFGKVYRSRYYFRDNSQLFPPGTAQPTPLLVPVVMPQGMIYKGSVKNNRTGFEMHITYAVSSSNTVVAGITYEEMKQYDVRFRANFLSTSNLMINIPLPRVVSLTDIQNFNRSVKRNFKACFIEDIWDISDTIRLTIGARYDDYSDFGSSFNPRIGLTWEFTKGYDLKVLYGRAFRAPSFSELYDLASGNPGLDPEEVDTYEISLGAEFTASISGRLTWFRNWTDESIGITYERLFDVVYVNHGRQRSEGMEIEMKYDFGRGTYLAVNYTYHIFKKRFLWIIPRHSGNIMANMRLSRYVNLYVSCHFEDGFRRDRGDSRDDMSGYAIVNSTLIAKKFLKGYEGLEIRASVYNLLDKDYTSPTAAIGLPEDIPRPGRNFMFEVKYNY